MSENDKTFIQMIVFMVLVWIVMYLINLFTN